jgi:hypothetical protein
MNSTSPIKCCRWTFLLICVSCALVTPIKSTAVSVTFDATHQTGLNYIGSISVSGYTFSENEGFVVLFPADLFTSATDAATGNAGWDVFLQGPDAVGTDYLTLAFSGGVSTSLPFTFNFEYGSGSLSGPFEVQGYLYDSAGFVVSEIPDLFVFTQSSGVPEQLPTGAGVALAAISLLVARKKLK